MSVGQDSRHNLSASGSRFWGLQSGCWLGLQSCQVQLRLKNLPPSSLMGLLTDLRFLLRWPLHKLSECPHDVAAGGLRGESYPKAKAEVISELLLKMTFYHFCHILCVRIKSTNPAHTQGYKYWRGYWAHLSDCLQQSSFPDSHEL